MAVHTLMASVSSRFTYFLGGDGEFINGKTSYLINPGVLFISTPHTVHTIKARRMIR